MEVESKILTLFQYTFIHFCTRHTIIVVVRHHKAKLSENLSIRTYTKVEIQDAFDFILKATLLANHNAHLLKKTGSISIDQ